MALTRDDVDRLARAMVAQVDAMKRDGTVPAELRDFADLHEHFDANVGWGDEVDALALDDWRDVQNRAHELLQACK